ncbi:MAG TPA: hypothetical protein VE934_16930 [Polaromonas sp.]|uniref:hypothetical protein n=1 Tax=Polaromonas sp. TaxID=1869339 RepID=UPI002D6EB1E3|nr:hypothetical protein [Polaromonas sp.]HYW58636.1 hypothetical protein [Polaromonas sp.]
MSLLTRFLDDTTRAELSQRVTPNGFRLEDVTRAGTRHPDSLIGVYAPDPQSYAVFCELFDPILQHFKPPCHADRDDRPRLNPRAVVSTRIRVARNLVGHVFPAGMTRMERLSVEAKITRACGALVPEFGGWIRRLGELPGPKLVSMVSRGLAFGPDDPYMASANIHADWPIGRSVFNTCTKQVSVWINEEDHLRVAVILPGASIAACSQAMNAVMTHLANHLEFCRDAERGYLTSCPSNAGSAMRVSYRIDLNLDPSQEAILEELETTGRLQIRGAAGEHAPRGRLIDVSLRKRVGISEAHLLQHMEDLLVPTL